MFSIISSHCRYCDSTKIKRTFLGGDGKLTGIFFIGLGILLHFSPLSTEIGFHSFYLSLILIGVGSLSIICKKYKCIECGGKFSTATQLPPFSKKNINSEIPIAMERNSKVAEKKVDSGQSSSYRIPPHIQQIIDDHKKQQSFDNQNTSFFYGDIPNPLRDPGGLWAIYVAIYLVVIIIQSMREYDLISVAIFFPLLILLILQGPWEKPSCLVLRGFSNDQNFTPLRRILRRNLPSNLRISGVRPPKARFNFVLWMIFSGILIWFYLFGKKYDLTAGKDWPARLCRSLSFCRCVIFDLRGGLTKGLAIEIKLIRDFIIQNAVLFIINDKDDKEKWKNFIAEELGIEHSEIINFAIYPQTNKSNTNNFEATLMAFGKKIPSEPVQLSGGTYGIVENYKMSKVDQFKEVFWPLFLLISWNAMQVYMIYYFLNN